MSKPKISKLYDHVLQEVRDKNPGALGYQVEEMAQKEYAHRYALCFDDSPFEDDCRDELDAFFAAKFGTK